MAEQVEKKKISGKKQMAWWIVAVVGVTVVWSLLDRLGSWDSYEAGRIRAQKEMAARIEARILAGDRYYDPDLGVWISPSGHKHIRVTRRVRDFPAGNAFRPDATLARGDR